ncbi:MAG: glutamate--tRNA ligase, partial [Gemmataceae bacterium]
MAAGLAYPDYTTPAEQDSRRKAAELARKPYVHRGSHRDVAPEENLRLYDSKPAPVLLKVMPGQTVTFQDHVRGRVDVNTDTIRDPALLRAPGADGVCRALYSFATVVDEAAFGITHVIRAEEHLANTPTQVLIYQALGTTVPEFAHVPLIYRNGKKISKRDLPPLSEEEKFKLRACGWTQAELEGRDDLNLATVAYYRELGYLPGALLNYLARLGWSLDATTEYIPVDVLVANFSLDRVTKAPGNFDIQKLFWLQGEYMKRLSTPEKLERSRPYLHRAGLMSVNSDATTDATLSSIIDAAGERIKLLSDLIVFARPVLQDTYEFDPAAETKARKSPTVNQWLSSYSEVLSALPTFDTTNTEAALQQTVATIGIKTNELVLPVRVAITGTAVGFGLFDTMAILGRDRVLARIAHTLARWNSTP